MNLSDVPATDAWQAESQDSDFATARERLGRILPPHGFVEQGDTWTAPPHTSNHRPFSLVGTVRLTEQGSGWRLTADLRGVEEATQSARRTGWLLMASIGFMIALFTLFADSGAPALFFVVLALPVCGLFLSRRIFQRHAERQLTRLLEQLQAPSA